MCEAIIDFVFTKVDFIFTKVHFVFTKVDFIFTKVCQHQHILISVDYHVIAEREQ